MSSDKKRLVSIWIHEPPVVAATGGSSLFAVEHPFRLVVIVIAV